MQKSKYIDISYEISAELAKHVLGEEFHPDYLKHKNSFRKLIKAQNLMYKKLKAYFEDFAVRLVNNIDWITYDQKKVKASDFFSVNWKGETLNIKVILTEAFIEAILAGGSSAEEDMNVELGWSSADLPANKFLKTYIPNLIKNINNTTKDVIRKVLDTSIGLGESTEQASKRITEVIGDPKRALKIANTESVRAFTQGRLEAGKQIGATHKIWDATLSPCPVCSRLDEQKVEIDAFFKDSLSGELFDGPPAHPNCRCILRLTMK